MNTALIPKALVTTAALGVAGVAMYGSAAALYKIALADDIAAPWTLPFCLDALAIVCTAAGVFAGQTNQWVRWGPRLGYGASAAFQLTDALTLGQRAPFSHMAALGAALLLSEVVFKMWAPTPTKTTRPSRVARKGSDTRKEDIPTEPVEVEEAPEMRPPSTRPARQSVPSPDLEATALTVIADLRATNRLSGVQFINEMRHRGCPIGNTKGYSLFNSLTQETVDA